MLQDVFRDIFDNESMEIYPEMSAIDHEEWDSLTHFQLIVSVERKFNFKFTTDEVMKLKNVNDFINLINLKRNI